MRGKLQTASVTTAKPSIPDPKPVAAPGTEIYTAKRGEAIPTIARRYLSKTSYLTSSELADGHSHRQPQVRLEQHS